MLASLETANADKENPPDGGGKDGGGLSKAAQKRAKKKAEAAAGKAAAEAPPPVAGGAAAGGAAAGGGGGAEGALSRSCTAWLLRDMSETCPGPLPAGALARVRPAGVCGLPAAGESTLQ